MVAAGALNRRIVFQKRRIVNTDNGYRAEVWTDHISIWAQKITTGGREFYAAQKFNEETTAVFRIRYTSAVNSAMRIRDGAAYYEILPPLNDVNGKHEELLISARELL